MSTPEEEKAPKRTSAQIAADLEAERARLASSVDELTTRLSPRVQATELKDQAVSTAKNAAESAKGFVNDVKEGKPAAVKIAGGVAAGVVLLVGLRIIARKRS